MEGGVLMPAYTDANAIAMYLQRPLSDGEQAAAALVADAATAYIERSTGRAFGAATVTSELHRVDGPIVFLRRTPVDSVQSVSIRPLVAGATAEVLTAGKTYELLDGATGKLSIAVWWDPLEDRIPAVWAGWQMTVAYTVVVLPPRDIALAATMIAAAWLSGPEMEKYQSLTLDGISVTRVANAPIPPIAAELLRGRRKLVFA